MLSWYWEGDGPDPGRNPLRPDFLVYPPLSYLLVSYSLLARLYLSGDSMALLYNRLLQPPGASFTKREKKKEKKKHPKNKL